MNNSFKKRSEFRYGSSSRTIPLPMPVDNNQVKGDYQDGILTLELPKLQKQENEVTKVSIGSGKNQQLDQSQASNFGSETSSTGGTSEVSAKEQLNTHGSGEPSADNVDVQTESQASS